MRETKADMLQGLFGVASAKTIRPNTLRIKFDDGTEVVRLHRTNILTFYPDGSTVYNSGGWKTLTTRDRMNNHGPAVIRQEKGVWYISTDGWETQSVYYDGVTVKDGQVLNPQAAPSASRASRKRGGGSK